MRRGSVAIVLVFGLVAGFSTAHAAQSLLKNGSMEDGQAFDEFVPADWTELAGNVERSAQANVAPPGEGHSLKAFGDPVNAQTGAYQDHPVNPGQSVTVNWSNFTLANDKLGGAGSAGIRVEFLGFFNNIISAQENLSFTAASPADTWIADTLGPLVAPANTVKVRVYCKLAWSGAVNGAVWWDDVHILVGGTDVTDNGDFETAGPPELPGISEWLGFGVQGAQSNVVSSHGEFSLAIDTSEQFSGRYQRIGEVVAGEEIRLKAKVMHLSSDPVVGSTVLAGLKLEFLSAGPSVPPVENLAFDDAAPQDTWTLVEVSTSGLVVPDGISTARVVMIYVGDETTSNGRVFFDSAAVHLNSGAANLLTNPSFEDGIGGGFENWNVFFTQDESTVIQDCFGPANDGDCACRASGTAVAGAYQDVELGDFGAGPGDTLDVSAFLYVPSTDPLAAGALAGVKVEWISGSKPPNIDIVPNPNNPVVLDENSPTDTWIDLEINYTMPPGTGAIAQFTNIMAFAGGVSQGTVYFDDCEAVVLNRFDGADANGDDRQDLFDYYELQRCYSGDGVTPLLWNCTVFDVDDDLDVDLTDFLYFQPRMTGP